MQEYTIDERSILPVPEPEGFFNQVPNCISASHDSNNHMEVARGTPRE